MDDCPTLSVKEALAQLQEIAPSAPFLALGQTVYWDEPMKGGLALASKRLGYSRRFIAGVHDTDYFAKLPSGRRSPGKFKAMPHNDTTTQGLWSAAGEFSALFGSETVVTRDLLHKGGLKFDKLTAVRPNFLDDATEAWGWRGIVSLDESPPITAELPLRQVFGEIKSTLVWALDQTVGTLTGQAREIGKDLSDDLRAMICDAQDEVCEQKPKASLADLYRYVAPKLYDFVAGKHVDLEVSATTELLRFNRETADLPRFELLDLFAAEATRKAACEAYNNAVRGTGLYELNRFGTGAVPFDVVIPGRGRGTLRITRKAIIIMTPKPLFITLKKPLSGVADLAAALERKFGSNCVVVGKAVTLIGMLAREFVFVFHEGASDYVRHSRKLHQNLAAVAGKALQINPILRIRYNAWDALQVSCSWLKLPEPFHRAFGTEELCAPSFAGRWRTVVREQEQLLQKLGAPRRPVDLLSFLDEKLAGSWKSLAEEYEGLQRQLGGKVEKLLEARSQRQGLYEKRRELKRARVAAEVAMGEHFRDKIFEKDASASDLQERENLRRSLREIIAAANENEKEIRSCMHRQKEIAHDPEVLKLHDRRRSIELEAELKRLRLIRSAVISSKGLERANRRPSAWWFRLVCPDGLWFRETVDSAEYYLEPLV